MASSSPRRTLMDLYRPGVEHDVKDQSDPDSEPIKVWVKKMSAAEQEHAVDRSQIARAKATAKYRDRDSDEYLALVSDYRDLSTETLVDMLLREEEFEQSRKFEQQVIHEDESEWAENGYLEGLLTSWQEGLNDAYAIDPEDTEARKVYEEINRFQEEVSERLTEWREARRENLLATAKPDLIDKAIKSQIDLYTTEAWLREYNRWQIHFCVYDIDSPNRSSRYFDKITGVDGLASETRDDLLEAINNLEVSVTEGKGSAAPPSSSTSSEPPQET